MLTRFLNYIDDNQLFDPDSRILLAVSGGIDSVVMAHLFSRSKYSFGIAHCNFKLRGKESDLDEIFTAQLSEKFQVPFYKISFQTKDYSKQARLSIQMAARDLRYKWFDKIREDHNYDFIAVAHQRDDEIETFLINLLRGTGILGLHGILPKRDRIVRPLLFASRNDIEEYAMLHSLKFREDESNKEEKYLRNRIRHKIIPLLDKISPDALDNITASISKIRDAEKIYNETIRARKEELIKFSGHDYRLSIEAVRRLTPAKTWIYELLKDFGCTESLAGDIVELLDSEPGRLIAFERYILLRDRDELIIQEREGVKSDVDLPGIKEYHIREEDAETEIPLKLSITRQSISKYVVSKEGSIAALDLGKLHFPLIIRKWKKGDYFYPLGMNSKKKLSDFFIDEKFSRFQKDKTWLLCSGDKIAWIIGKRIDDRFKITSTTRIVYQIKLEP